MAARPARWPRPTEAIEGVRQLRFIQPQIRDERIGPGTREVVRLPGDRRNRAPHGPARREALNIRLVAVLPPLPDHSPVGGEVRAGGDVAGWIDCLGEVNGGNGPPGILPVEGSDPEALRRCLHAQVLAVEVTVNQGRGRPVPVRTSRSQSSSSSSNRATRTSRNATSAALKAGLSTWSRIKSRVARIAAR